MMKSDDATFVLFWVRSPSEMAHENDFFYFYRLLMNGLCLCYLLIPFRIYHTFAKGGVLIELQIGRGMISAMTQSQFK